MTASASCEDAVDVVLDQQHRHVGRDRLDQVADALALGRGEAGERLVEQQHARLGRERQRHVEQPLAAVARASRPRRVSMPRSPMVRSPRRSRR